jgi:hypothetical protein
MGYENANPQAGNHFSRQPLPSGRTWAYRQPLGRAGGHSFQSNASTASESADEVEDLLVGGFAGIGMDHSIASGWNTQPRQSSRCESYRIPLETLFDTHAPQPLLLWVANVRVERSVLPWLAKSNRQERKHDR